MKWLKSILGIMLAIAGLGAVASSVYSLIDLTDDVNITIDFVTWEETELGSGEGVGTTLAGTYESITEVVSQEYPLVEVTFDTNTYSLNIDLLKEDNYYAIIWNGIDVNIYSDNHLTSVYNPFSTSSEVLLTFNKPLLNTTSILLITLIPLTFVGGLLTYMLIKQKEE